MSPLSGYQMWKAGQAKARHKVKNWAARILTKQARKVQNNLIERWRIYRGDQVMVVAGKDKGQVGTVSKVYRKENRLLVEGLNLVKKHVKRSGDNPGGIITMEAPIHYSNVNLVDPVTGAATRARTRFLDDGTKVRYTVGRNASGSIVPKPDVAATRTKPRKTDAGSRDTGWEHATANTYAPAPENRGFFGGGGGGGAARSFASSALR
jgi:large subunit ribosomal protein L24